MPVKRSTLLVISSSTNPLRIFAFERFRKDLGDDVFLFEVGIFNRGRAYEFRFAVASVNIEIEAAGGKRGNALQR